MESDPSFALTDSRIQWGDGGVERLTRSIYTQVNEGLSRLSEQNLELNLDGTTPHSQEVTDGQEDGIIDENKRATEDAISSDEQEKGEC